MPIRIDIPASRTRLLVAASVLCAGEVLAYFAATRFVSTNGMSGRVLGSLVYPLMEALAVAALVFAARRASGRRRAFFGLMALSTLLGLCGDVTWAVLVFVVRSAPSPSIADGFYEMGLIVAGAAVYAEFGSQLHRWRELLDMSMWFLAAVFLIDAVAVHPQMKRFMAVEPVVLVEAVLAALLGAWVVAGLITTRRRLPLGVKIVAYGIVLQAVSWIAYTYVSVRGIQDGSWTYTGWQATWALLIIGALSEITRRDPEDAREHPARHTSAWVATSGLVVLCVSIIPTMHPHGLQITGLALGMGGVLIILVRFHASLRVEGRLTARLHVMAETDALTGIANRRTFDQHLEAAADIATETGRRPLGALVMDIDRFKLINDGFGHHVGDQVLRIVAGRLASVIRPGDTLARIGGEEFGLLALGVPCESLADLAERCRHAVGLEPVTVDAHAIPVTISVGAASMPAHATDAEQLVRVADRALYEAKYAGRNRVHIGLIPGIQRAIPISETGVVGQLEALVDRLDAEQAEQEHSLAMVDVTAHLCTALNVTVAQRRRCLAAARLHDIGKVGTPPHILTKPGPLNTAETIVIQDHARAGAELLHAFPETRELARIVGEHHEWVDGSGYPEGKHAGEISVEARIISVADAWTAMLADRPYRAALTTQDARSELIQGAGTQFDNSVVSAMLDIIDYSLLLQLPPRVATSATRSANLPRP